VANRALPTYTPPPMTGVLVTFLVGAAALWLSVFGYLLALRLLIRIGDARAEPSDWPEVAVIVPTRNEEAFIAAKLADLRRTDYPADRLAILVVDGGSTDDTAELVQAAIDVGAPLSLLRLGRTRGKSEQVERALARVKQEIVVVTDADAVLEPGCVRELVRTLSQDPQTAIVGASVRPATPLLEERMHWWLLNRLWWLEGEVLSAALVSGVCYAVRRSCAAPLVPDGTDDAQLALGAGARGLRARLCPAARATEMRVPRSPSELLEFRRRRGLDYARALRRAAPGRAPFGWRLARAIRLWHFRVAPAVGLAVAALGFALLASDHWPWAMLAFAAFALPALAMVARGASQECRPAAWWQIGFATTRLLALTWLALLTLPRYTAARD